MLPDHSSKEPFWNSLWGFLLTLGVATFIFIAFSFIQSMALVSYGFYLQDWNPSADINNMFKTLIYNGDAISIAEIPAALFGVSLVFLFSKLRTPMGSFHYLQLKSPTIRQLLIWLGIMILVMVLMEVTNIVLDRETPDFMSKVYFSTTNYTLLLIAVAVAAPFFEELLFRGYLLEGLRNTWVGNAGAILISSASWAIIHLQYGWFEIITIFLIGIVFSVAKLKTRSLYIPIAMHMLMNLTASILMEIG